ncbi:MAG: lipopolysaccharide biosynthesis protein [Xanthomonadales bacterium]|nr:lipopolysaccharide biosynthesis protein [Xanthomonadales bacterium]
MLKRRAFEATLWSGVEVMLRQGLQFAVTVILARILDPSEFGTVATLALFIAIATVLMDGGFSLALLQRQDITHVDESTVFWFNLVMGGLFSAALALAGPALAIFFELPALRSLAPVLGLTVFIASLGAIHATLINKRLEFRKLLGVNVVATIAASVVAITLALAGFGVWALVAQALVMATVTTTMLWVVGGWRPSWVFSRASARKLFGFGGYTLVSSLLDAAYTRFYTVIVGRWFGTRDLGYYNNADTTRQMPTRFVGAILLRAALPMFAEAAQNPQKLRRGLQLSICGTMRMNAPLMLGGAALAEPLVRVVFGLRWLPAAPILSVLCLAGVLYPLHALNLHVLLAQGHSKRMFHIEVAKKIMGIALIVAGSFFGLIGIAWSQVAFSILSLALNTHYSGKFLGYGLVAQSRDVLPTVALALVMAAVVAALDHYWPWETHAAIRFGVLICTGAVFFIAGAAALRLEAFRDVALIESRSSSRHGEMGTL